MAAGPLQAAVFDLDGVVTRTARVHFATWKRLFDGFFAGRPARPGEDPRPFTERDYLALVDGKPRVEGARAFLASRGVKLPVGSLDDPPGAGTLGALARRKNELFQAELERTGVEVDPAAVELVRRLRESGVRVGVATSSRNGAAVLRRAGLETLFDARVDGEESAALGLRGKPDPDAFLECLRRLGATDPRRALLIEDAAAGIRAGRAGGFGLVVGVDRGGNGARLREAGADLVVDDLRELTVDLLVRCMRARAQGADEVHR